MNKNIGFYPCLSVPIRGFNLSFCIFRVFYNSTIGVYSWLEIEVQ